MKSPDSAQNAEKSAEAAERKISGIYHMFVTCRKGDAMQEYVVNRPDEGAMDRALRENSGNAAGAVLRLAWQAGLLRDEIQHLTWERVDFLDGCLVLPDRRIPIDRELVALAFSQDPELALSMTKYLARTVRLLSRQVDQMAFRPAQWRVADCLLTLSSDGGPACCTQDDIAAAVSASRVTVSRILNGFAKRGWVELGYRSVTLLDREALARLCRPS